MFIRPHFLRDHAADASGGGTPAKEAQKKSYRIAQNMEAGGLKLDEGQKGFVTGMESEIIDIVSDGLKGVITDEVMTKRLNDAIDKATKGLATEDYVKSLEESLRTIGLQVSKGQGKGQKSGAQYKSISEQAKEQVEARKDEWQAFRDGKQQNFSFTVQFPTNSSKAAQTMQVNNSVSPDNTYFPFPEFDPNIGAIIRPRTFILDYVNKSRATSPLFVYVERFNPQGDAAFTAEGGVKPLYSFQWRTASVKAKKVTEKTKLSTETLKDIPDMMGQINTELKTVLDLKVDEKLLSGNSSLTPEEIDGLLHLTGGYVITAFNGKVPFANKFDVIKVVSAQIRNANFIPTHIFLNDLDATQMDLTKDSQGRYILPPFTTPNGMVVGGIVVVPSNRVTVDQFVMGDMSKFEVKMWEEFAITMGWVNDDFEKNFVTVIGESRLFSFIRTNNLPAFVNDTFSNVQGLIGA